jgi:hypothetical protein
MKKHNLNTMEETINMMRYNAKYCEADCVVLFEGLKAFNSIINREAGGQGEFSVGLAARRDVASQPAT